MCGPRDDDLAFGAGRDVLVGLEVDDPHFEVGDRQTRRVEARPVRVVDRVAVQARQLGGAVGAQPTEPRAFGDRLATSSAIGVAAHIM